MKWKLVVSSPDLTVPNRRAYRARTDLTFRQKTDGGVTILGLYFFLAIAMILGLALDGANGWRVRAQLQVATDAAALAAAANLDDIDYARSLAVQVASLNLSDNVSLGPSDIVFGSLDEDTLVFTAAPNDVGDYTAVKVNAGRANERGNSVPTFLMGTIGIDTLDVGAVSMAVASAGTGTIATCQDALFLSTDYVDTGGGNTFSGAVCIHGANGVRTGGGDTLNENVRFTAESLSNIDLNSYTPTSLDEAQLVAARTLEPVLLPQLDAMRTSIWDDLWISRAEDASLWEQPDAPWGGKQWYYVGEYQITAADYDGILPDFIFDSSGTARVEMHDQYWSIQPGDLQPNTVYLSEQSMQFAGGVDIEDAAFISKADIGVGGGSALFFDDVYFIGSAVNMSGSITWGEPVDACDVEYGVYIFGTTSLSLGGWYSGASVNGMVGASPTFDPGGGMTGTGVYFETNSYLSMGGSYNIYGCEDTHQSDLPIANAGFSSGSSSKGSLLYR